MYQANDFIIENGILIKYQGSEKDVVIPRGITSIGRSAFRYNIMMRTVAIPDTVEEIGKEAFWGCRYLESVIIPDSVTIIGEAAFDGCCDLKSVIIPEGVTSIESSVFFFCSSLTKVVIPKNITSIGEGAFYGCENLTSVEFQGKSTSVARYAFKGCNLKSIILPEGSQIIIVKDAFGDKLPKELYDSIGILFRGMKDGALKQYVLNEEIWNTLPLELKAEVFLSKQGKDLNTAYTKYTLADDKELMGKEILKVLTAQSSAKTCNAAGKFLVLFPDVSDELFHQIYNRLKTIKAGSKAIQAIEAAPFFAGRLGKSVEIDQTLTPVGQKVMAFLIKENKTEKGLITELKDVYSLTPSDYKYLPELTDQDGRTVERFVLSWFLLKGRNGTLEITDEENEIIEMLDHISFMRLLYELKYWFLGAPEMTKNHYLAFPLCRYADDVLLENLTMIAHEFKSRKSGKNAPPLRIFREAILYSNSCLAMKFADQYGDLKAYAELRGGIEEDFRTRYLSETGLDSEQYNTYSLEP